MLPSATPIEPTRAEAPPPPGTGALDAKSAINFKQLDSSIYVTSLAMQNPLSVDGSDEGLNPPIAWLLLFRIIKHYFSIKYSLYNCISVCKKNQDNCFQNFTKIPEWFAEGIVHKIKIPNMSSGNNSHPI